MAWVGGANEASGVTKTLSGMLNGVAGNIDNVATAVGALVAVGVARYFGNMASGAMSATAGLVTAARNEVALAEAQFRGTQIATARARAAVYRAQQAVAAARGTEMQIAAEARLAATQERLNRNIAARTAAQNALNSTTAVGSRLMTGALGLVGGVCGITGEMNAGITVLRWRMSSTTPPRISVRTDAASACAGVRCAAWWLILAVSFPLINFRSKSRFMTQTESAILAHARRCAPAESCGFVVRTPEGERYLPCVNISAEPEAYFRIAPEDWLRAEMQGEIVALVHSHPGGLPWLSEADRRLQIKSALSWWLVCRGEIHKFRCVPHLTGRRFEHGVTDCYTLFRDAYHLAGIDMPDFEREDDWWRNGQNLYLDNMAVTGFYRVPLSSAQAGDILLCCFGASVPNHAAIYCGNGELLHHLPEQLSKRERYSEKWQRRTHSVWRHRHWHASAFTGIYNDLAAASACM